MLIKWYLRFNGFFTVDNFVVHAADDKKRISKGVVGNYTDVDVLALRLPFYTEKTGELEIPVDQRLKRRGKIEIIIAECKTGNKSELNSIWKNSNIEAIEYILKFCGVIEAEKELTDIAKQVASSLRYEDNRLLIQVILFGQSAPSKYWSDRNILFISYAEVVSFLQCERGQCWIKSGIGDRSIHDSWDDTIKNIFLIANDIKLSSEQKRASIDKILS